MGGGEGETVTWGCPIGCPSLPTPPLQLQHQGPTECQWNMGGSGESYRASLPPPPIVSLGGSVTGGSP